MTYCPYTNQDIPDAEMNSDHIVPLSLGGLNGFEVLSCKKFNAHSGSKIEGAIVNDFLFMFARRDSDARGHSRKTPIPVWKKSKMDGSPVQISWGDDVKMWDSVKRTYIDETDSDGKTFESTHQIDRHSTIILGAKIAVGTLFEIGGKDLLDATNSEGLRWLMNADMKSIYKNGKDSIPECARNIAVVDRFSSDRNSNDHIGFKYLVEHHKRTTILLVPFPNEVVICIGLLGMYLCTICIEAKSKSLVKLIKSDYGKAILLGPQTREDLCLKEYSERTLEELS